MSYSLVVERARGFDLVWLDAPHIVRFLGCQVVDQRYDGVLEVGASCDWSLGGLCNVLGTLRPHQLQDILLTVIEKSLEVLEQRVPVFVNEPGNLVCYLTSVMLDSEIPGML